MKYGNDRNGFFLPNELFQLGLDYGELAVYSFLKRCENRKTHQCWPSIRTIGQAVGMSENTVRKYIRRLEERELITTEPTEVITKSSGRRNGNLLFTLRPIGGVIDDHYYGLGFLVDNQTPIRASDVAIGRSDCNPFP